MTSCLVAYDVANNKTRRTLYRLLCAYGEPLQKSVFRCTLDSANRQRLDGELAQISLGPTDHLLVETMRDSCPIEMYLVAG